MLQVFNVAIGFISDGFIGIQIAANLLVGVIYDLAAAWVQLVSKFTWGDVKQKAIADMDVMATKAQEYYKKASDGALEFKSKGVQALDEIAKTQEQKNVESLADSKKHMDQVLANQQTELNGKKATEDEKLKAVQDYAESAIVANNGVMDGMMQADLIAKGYMVTMSEAGKVSVQAWDKSAAGAEKNAASADKARKAATALGLDLDVSLNRVSAKFKENEASVNNFVSGLEALGITGKQAADVTYEAWVKWLGIAKSQAEIDFAKLKLQSFGEQGKLSTSQVEMGMQALKRAVQELPDALNPVEQAFERLGVKTKEQLKLSADLAMNDFNTILKSGKATQDGLQKAYEETIRLAYASGDAQAIATANAKAAYLGLEVQIDSTGKTTVSKLSEIQRAASATQQSIQQVNNNSSAEPKPAEDSLAGQDYWDEFKAKRAKINEATRARMNSTKAGASFRPLGLSAFSDSGPITPQADIANMAPMIASNFDIQGIEAMQPTEKKVLELVSAGKSANLEGTPEAVDAVDQMLSQLEMLKRGM